MNLELSVDGQRLLPDTQGDGWVSFRLHFPAREVRLLSGCARPMDLRINPDPRWLGVCVSALQFQKAASIADLPLNAAEFTDGFHNLEEDRFRWTNGNAMLPATLFPPWTGEVLLHVSVSDWAGTNTQSAVAESTGELLNAFESLGADCEFAFAQRHFRATQPAGLMSWSATDCGKLIRGLDNEFAGVGSPDSTELIWDIDEYKLRTPYFQTHTGHYKKGDAKAAAAIIHSSCARLRLLRRKLLADIAAARRIFVFKCHEGEMSRTEILALHQAVRRIGPASLLCVMGSTASRPAGMVERLAEGLYLGGISRFVMGQGPYDEWQTICHRTLKLQAAPH